jgi:hypothetical protein
MEESTHTTRPNVMRRSCQIDTLRIVPHPMRGPSVQVAAYTCKAQHVATHRFPPTALEESCAALEQDDTFHTLSCGVVACARHILARRMRHCDMQGELCRTKTRAPGAHQGEAQ